MRAELRACQVSSSLKPGFPNFGVSLSRSARNSCNSRSGFDNLSLFQKMALRHSVKLQCLFSPLKKRDIGVIPQFSWSEKNYELSPSKLTCWSVRKLSMLDGRNRILRDVKSLSLVEKLGKKAWREDPSDTDDDEDDNSVENRSDDAYNMDAEDRREWRKKIWEVIEQHPDIEEEVDLVEKRRKMQKLLAEYPLLVNEEDPSWPEDADGWGFNLDQFFDKITIKNVKKEGDDDDDENSDSEREVVWQDDNFIRPIKDVTTAEWEETVFKDISPLIILVHNRYKRPKANEKSRDELEKAVHIIWNCGLPSPRCVAVDAVVERDLASALEVSFFPEVIFTKAGKILYREKGVRDSNELSKIMAFFYYGATKPECLNGIGDCQEAIPMVAGSGTT